MKLLRNREIRRLLAAFAAIGAAAGLLSFCIGGIGPFGIMIASCLAFTLLAYLFMHRLYSRLENLAADLRKISAGETAVDIRDYQEGEWSILKDEIYKMSVILQGTAQTMTKERTLLAHSLSDIAHQVKTPLTSMLVMVDLLLQGGLSQEDEEKLLFIIQAQIIRMEWLASSLLKLSKLDSATIEFKSESIKVRELIDKALQPLLVYAELKNQQIFIKGEAYITITGDLTWNAEALTNILKNCIEHTPEDCAIHIQFSENPIYTEITIQDSGEGIAKEDMHYIFNRFFRGKNASKESVGIGLSMAQSIIRRQHGDIFVKSTPGQGATFTIRYYKPHIDQPNL